MKLKKHAGYGLHKYDKMAGHIPILINLITQHKCKVIAEVGVYLGRLMRAVLRSKAKSFIHEYWAIDPYKRYTSGDPKRNKQTQEEWDAIYLSLIPYILAFPQLCLIRAESLDVATWIRKPSFDLVFIDADHSYESVRADILAWAPLVKNDGLLAGHDYNQRTTPGVKQAVDELIGRDNITVIDPNGGKVWVKRPK